MMVLLQKNPLKERIPVFVLSGFICLLLCLRLLWDLILFGPKQFFAIKRRTLRPEVLDDPVYGQHNFARLKNVTLHYVEKGDCDKPLMLFLHGFPEFWYSWRHQLKEFGGNFRAVAVDMRGYGESSKPSDITSYSMDKLVMDIKEFIEYLGYQKGVVVAHDWGGAVAWSFAHMYPSMVEKLVICNCPFSAAFRKLLRTSNQQKKMSWYMAAFQTPLLPELALRTRDLQILDDTFRKSPNGVKKMGAITDDDMEAMKFTFAPPGAFVGPINYYRATFLYKMPLIYPSKKVLVSTLIIWGTGDNALSKELAEMSGQYCEDCRIKYIEGASHWVQQEEPELVNQYIKEFVQQK